MNIFENKTCFQTCSDICFENLSDFSFTDLESLSSKDISDNSDGYSGGFDGIGGGDI